MSKNKPDKEYYLLFLLIFILAFAFGVAIGYYACSTGDSGDLTVNVENNAGSALNNVGVSVTDSSGTEVASGVTDSGGQVHFTNLDNGDYTVTATLGSGNAQVTNSTQVTIDGEDEQTTIVLGGFDGQDPSKPVE